MRVKAQDEGEGGHNMIGFADVPGDSIQPCCCHLEASSCCGYTLDAFDVVAFCVSHEALKSTVSNWNNLHGNNGIRKSAKAESLINNIPLCMT